MKVKNFYSVFVDGQTVFTGSRSQCESFFHALIRAMIIFDVDRHSHSVVVSFVPN